ncbi:mucin-like protein [Mytilus trossulus]|uniref:mucin-like protein n=1 Tax=Mytilus trossulus TaxID=6551 RepID=UPI0030040037
MIDFIEWARNQTRANVIGICHDFNTTTNINSFNLTRCSVDGQWGSWSSSPCSVSCGEGIGNRQRICDSPKPSVNGKDCVGPSMETMICNLGECPVDGQWSSWSTTLCSVSCGDGIGNRQRNCDSPKPSVNGKDCVGPSMETMICNLGECSVDGQWSSWSTSPCSVSCGDGIGNRQRICDSPKPSVNGKDCVGPSMETMTCNLGECLESCKESDKKSAEKEAISIEPTISKCHNTQQAI